MATRIERPQDEQAPERELKAAFAKKKNLVVAAINNLPKDGIAKLYGGGQYTYVYDAEVLRVVRAAMLEAGLSFGVAFKQQISEREIVTSKGGKWYNHLILIECHLTDTETGYSECYDWAAQGNDSGDKALNKAYTAAVKYFLMKTFLIPTGDDPEQDNPEAAAENHTETATQYPPIKHKDTQVLLEALLTYFTVQETEGFKLNKEKLKAAIVEKLGGRWPETAADANLIKSGITFIDIADKI